jgi:hypothetical protein
MSTPQAVRAAIAALLSAWLALALVAGTASAATDHVVITGGAVVPVGQTAGDVVVLDGTVTIAGHATGDVVSVSGPVRLTGRVDGDLSRCRTARSSVRRRASAATCATVTSAPCSRAARG